jgi:predicted dienelactone hydrolase
VVEWEERDRRVQAVAATVGIEAAVVVAVAASVVVAAVAVVAVSAEGIAAVAAAAAYPPPVEVIPEYQVDSPK